MGLRGKLSAPYVYAHVVEHSHISVVVTSDDIEETISVNVMHGDAPMDAIHVDRETLGNSWLSRFAF